MSEAFEHLVCIAGTFKLPEKEDFCWKLNSQINIRKFREVGENLLKIPGVTVTDIPFRDNDSGRGLEIVSRTALPPSVRKYAEKITSYHFRRCRIEVLFQKMACHLD